MTDTAAIDAQIKANMEASLAEIPPPVAAEGHQPLRLDEGVPPRLPGGGGRDLLHPRPRHPARVVGQLRRDPAGHPCPAQGFESAIYFYGPPGTLACMSTRGFPTVGDAGFPPGELNTNGSLETFIQEGGTVYCCRFGMALHGLREEDLIEGVVPTHPLDVQDASSTTPASAIINSTYQL